MRISRTLIIVMAAAFAIIISRPTSGSTNTADQEKMFKAWLEVINQDNDAQNIEKFIRKNYVPRLIDMSPMVEHVKIIQRLKKTHGKLAFHSYRETTEDRLLTLIRDSHDQWILVTLYFDPQQGLLRGFTINDRTDPPDVLDIQREDDIDDYATQVTQYAEQRASQDMFSGTMLMRLNGSEICRGVWGEASKRYGVSNRIDTKFNLGSMNKMFTAISIAQLAEKGLLSFDDKVGRHLPDYPNADVRDKVTIHHLLSHTSGMGSHFTEEFMDSARDQYRHFTEYIKLFADESLAFEPGHHFAYSNAGFFVLGMIVEAVSGESYYEYVRQNIYKPAGMTNTDCYDDDLPVPNLATGYTKQRFDEPTHEDQADWMDRLGSWRSNSYLHSIKGGPAGGGYSTVEDLARFAQALTNGKLISIKQLEIMTTSKTPIRTGEGDSTRGYGYGFSTGTLTDGTTYFGHSGGFPGINSVLHIFPERNGMIAVMANYDGGASPIAAFAERIMPVRK